MTHYTYHQNLHRIWQKASEKYKSGLQDKTLWFDEAETAFLDSIGSTVQEVFDFVDDHHRYGEPDETTFILLQDLRRHYFLNIQKGRPSGRVVQMSDLPPKDAEVDGIRWLPRLVQKAKAKLRGEMNPDLMYLCAGDRAFFKEHNIHPAEFLQIAMAAGDDDRQLIEWFHSRKNA